MLLCYGSLYHCVQRFESLENEHVDQMLIFTNKLLVACDTCASKQSTEYSKAKEKFEQLPSSKLLQMFAQIRGTGRRRPGMCVFVCTCVCVCVFVCVCVCASACVTVIHSSHRAIFSHCYKY